MDTEQRVIDQELLEKAARQIREDSAERVCLTAVGIFTQPPFELTGETCSQLLEALQNEEVYADIQRMSLAPGEDEFLYSDKSISQSYARLLLRKEQNNQCLLIGETVREESKIYPRPMLRAVLTMPPFGISDEVLAQSLEEMAQSEAYRDIKKITASTGNHYLYSDRYLTEAHARHIVEWNEDEDLDDA